MSLAGPRAVVEYYMIPNEPVGTVDLTVSADTSAIRARLRGARVQPTNRERRLLSTRWDRPPIGAWRWMEITGERSPEEG